MAKKKTQAEINAEIRQAVELLKQQAEEQAKISNSLEGYLDGVKRLKGIKKEEIRLEGILKDLKDELNKSTNPKDIEYNIKKIKLLKEQIKLLKKEGDTLSENLQKVNKANLLLAKGLGTTIKTFAKLPDIADGLRKKIKTLGVIDMDKAMKKSALSMGVLSKQTDGFRTNFKEASKYTNQLGIGIEELAKIQADYTEELGRNVMLGESGLKAISNIAAATNLGAEGAARLAADFENMGLSAERTAEYTEQVMNDSHKLGLNASKVIKNISQNMKMLNKYNFKGGVKGLMKMAETASKLGVDMNMVSGMADKLFDIEGAVDMSAQLQVMGGAWAQLADPFKLMYMARNDMEGLMEAVGGAAAASAKFNSKTKEFEISALEMHRLRKIAEQTGVSYEELAQAGKNAAKFTKIKGQIRVGGLSKEEQEFISNTAKFTEDGKAEIILNGSPKLVSQLTSADKKALQAQIKEKASLEERAKQAQTFDDQVTNLVNMLKTSALPLIEALNKKLMPKLQKLMDRFVKDKWLDKLGKLAESIGGTLGKVAGFFVDNPKLTAGLIGFATGIKLLAPLFEKVKWFSNGLALSQGFLAGTKGFGGGGRGGGGGGFGLGSLMDFIPGGGKGGMFRNMKAGWLKAGRGGKGFMGRMGGATKGMFNFGKGGGFKMGAGATSLGLGAAGLAGDIGRSFMDDPNSTGGKWLGVGSKAAEWAGTAGMVSKNPWVMLAAAIAGGLKGGYDEFFSDEATHGEGFDDAFIPKTNGKALLNGGKIHPIDNKDDLIAMKPHGAVDKAINQASTTSTMKIEFGEIRFKFDELKISAPGAPGTAVDLTKNPVFIRELTKMIHTETEKAIQGGKVKP